MKKFLLLILLILAILPLTSCVDYVQSISYKNGKYHYYYKITLSKILFEMMDENPEDIFENFSSSSFENLPTGIEIQPVNTDLEIGLDMKISINPKTTNEDEKKLLPMIAGNKYYVPFLLGTHSSFDDLNEISQEEADVEAIIYAMLSSAKCRILIGKNIIPEIETAYLEGKGCQNYSIPIFDYGVSHCLELPFITLVENDMYNLEKIVITKKQ